MNRIEIIKDVKFGDHYITRKGDKAIFLGINEYNAFEFALQCGSDWTLRAYTKYGNCAMFDTFDDIVGKDEMD